MKTELRNKLIKEIANKVDVECDLNYLISVYNKEYTDLNATSDEFGVRLANSPEEAVYRFVIITIPKSGQTMTDNEISFKAKEYNKLLDKLLKDENMSKPYNIGKYSWNDLQNIHFKR